MLPPKPEDWESGNIDERLRFLNWKRAEQPDEARELLANTASNESPPHLAKLITVFHNQLSSNDIPFLESLENHRRKEVRIAIRKLLIKLPESQLVVRMESRLQEIIQIQKGLIRDSLEIDPIGEISKELAKDGIADSAVAGMNIGKRAIILTQMVSYAPPSFWEEYLGLSPAKILSLAIKSDWAEALLHGMIQATDNYRDGLWAEAFVQIWLSDWAEKQKKKLEVIKPFLPKILHLVQADNLDNMLFQSINAIRHPDHNLNGLLLLEYLRVPISPRTAIIFAEKIMGILGTFSNRVDYRFRAFVYELAKSVYCFPPEIYSQVANIWARSPYETNWYDPYVDRALKLLEFRNQMKKEVEKE